MTSTIPRLGSFIHPIIYESAGPYVIVRWRFPIGEDRFPTRITQLDVNFRLPMNFNLQFSKEKRTQTI